jgi:hypothetical protein
MVITRRIVKRIKRVKRQNARKTPGHIIARPLVKHVTPLRTKKKVEKETSGMTMISELDQPSNYHPTSAYKTYSEDHGWRKS